MKNKNHILISLLFTLLVVGFIISKIPYTLLPFYWDESWVYGPAVRWMGENGPGLLPDALPVELGRGHPLLFHFLGGCWANLYGNNLFSLHMFALVISAALIISVFHIVKKLFSPGAAICCSVLICLQPVFFAQSVLVLPEVLMTVFICWGIYYYIRKKNTWYVIFTSLAILTKETAIVLPLTVLVFETTMQFKNGFSLLPWIKRCFLFASPLLFFALTLWLNYIYYGWFIFPEHKQSISNDPTLIWKNLTKGYGAFLFVYQARNVLSAMLILTAIYLLVRKQKIKFSQPVWFIILFMALFLIFSSFNFYSNRYILSAIILFCALVSVAVTHAKLHFIFPALAVLTFAFFSVREMQKDNHNDHHPGYKNYVLAREKLVDWCIKNKLQDKFIATDFLTQVALTNPYAGYVRPEETFTRVAGVPYDDVNCIIVNPKDDEAGLDKAAGEKGFILIKQVSYREIVFNVYVLKL